MACDARPDPERESFEYGVTLSREFAEQLVEHYPEARSVPDALRMAAREGVCHRKKKDCG